MTFSLIPLRKFTIVCFRPKNEVLRSLQENITNTRHGVSILDSLFETRQMTFVGELSNSSFSIALKGRDSFKPSLEGRIRDGGYKTFIDVTAQPHIITMIISGGTLLVFLFLLVKSAFGNGTTVDTIGLGIAIFLGYAICGEIIPDL